MMGSRRGRWGIVWQIDWKAWTGKQHWQGGKVAAHRVKKMEWKGRLDVRKQLSSGVFFPLFFFFFFFWTDSPSLAGWILEPLCFQIIVGGGELTTSQTMSASSPSMNSCGLEVLLNVIFSVGEWTYYTFLYVLTQRVTFVKVKTYTFSISVVHFGVYITHTKVSNN